MNNQKEILQYAKKASFDLVEVIPINNYKHHYLYILQKNS